MVQAHAIQIRATAAAILLCATSSTASASDAGNWSVAKATGQVWLATAGATSASLDTANELKPGDAIRTGPSGRVLLKRGEETILVAPNSSVTIPNAPDKGLETTILQQAGSILLEVEKKNVQHFEVATPSLAAVVKGTRFRVTVTAEGTSVAVLRGQVEVADYRSGEIAQVHPGQTAASHGGRSGLSLSGAGPFDPIGHGPSRAPLIERLPVPKGGLHAPRSADAGHHVVALDHAGHGAGALGHSGVRIATALGEVRLDVHHATHGLVRGDGVNVGHRGSQSSGTADSVQNALASTTTSDSTPGSAVSGSSGSSGNSGSASSAATASSGASGASGGPTVSTSYFAADHDNGNAYGKRNGNGNGNENGNGSDHGHGHH